MNKLYELHTENMKVKEVDYNSKTVTFENKEKVIKVRMQDLTYLRKKSPTSSVLLKQNGRWVMNFFT